MARSKRWGGPRIVPYNPNARDADHDGMVQEGTNWERPGGTKFVNRLGQEIAAAARASTPGSYIADANGNRVDYTPTWQRPGAGDGVDAPGGGLPRLGDVGYPSIGDTHGTISQMVGTVEGPPEVPDIEDRRDVEDIVPEPPRVFQANELVEPIPFRPDMSTKIGAALYETESSEELRSLFDDEYIAQAEDAFVDLLNTEVDEAAREVYAGTQRSLLARGLPERFVIWRQTNGRETDGGVESFSLNKKTNTSTFTEQRPFVVDRSSILVDTNAFYPSAFVGENEVLVHFGDVEPVELEKATDVPETLSALTGELWEPEAGLTPHRLEGAGLYTLPDMFDYKKSDNNMDPWYDEWRQAVHQETHRRQAEGIERFWDHAGRIGKETETGDAMRIWRQDFSNSSSMRRIISGQDPSPAYDNDRTRREASVIAEALERAPELGDPQWRVQTIGGELKPGAELDFPAVSAAVSRPEAEGFLSSTDVITDAVAGANPVLFKFPPDTRGVYHDDDGYLPRESIVTGKFRVASVEPSKVGSRDVDVVTLESVGPSELNIPSPTLSRSAEEVAENIEDAITEAVPDPDGIEAYHARIEEAQRVIRQDLIDNPRLYRGDTPADDVAAKIVSIDEPVRVESVLVSDERPTMPDEFFPTQAEKSLNLLEELDADVPLGEQTAERALYEYQNKGFVSVNQKLRDGEELDDEDLAKTTALERAIDASPAEEDFVVYRGLKVEDLFGEDADSDEVLQGLIGTRISDEGFLSTTTDPETGLSYGVSRDQETGEAFDASFDLDYIVMRAEVPEGTPALFKDTRWGEQEVVMKPGQEFEVVGVTAVRKPDNGLGADAVGYIVDVRAVDERVPAEGAVTEAGKVQRIEGKVAELGE